MDQFQLDVASTVLRIEQLVEERNRDDGHPSSMFWLLLGRLESDARRLRTHLTPETLAEMKRS